MSRVSPISWESPNWAKMKLYPLTSTFALKFEICTPAPFISFLFADGSRAIKFAPPQPPSTVNATSFKCFAAVVARGNYHREILFRPDVYCRDGGKFAGKFGASLSQTRPANLDGVCLVQLPGSHVILRPKAQKGGTSKCLAQPGFHACTYLPCANTGVKTLTKVILWAKFKSRRSASRNKRILCSRRQHAN